jgi:hypothetical protein
MSHTNRLLVSVFYIILVVTLLFGLWPLNLWPRNEVDWLKNRSGIELHRSGINGRYVPRGIVFSENTFEIPTKLESGFPSFSIELYIESKIETGWGISRIVSFTDPGQQESLILAQWKKHLIIFTPNTRKKDKRDFIELDLLKGLPTDSARFFTITSGRKGTRIYLNGNEKKYFPNVFLVSEDKSISGKMILGNSASGTEPWAGKIFGIGIYEEELSPEIIRKHYRSWLSNKISTLNSTENAIAIYAFEEGEGTLAASGLGQDKRLLIPRRFVILERTILEPPWSNFRFEKHFLFDFIINLLGFIPLGIMFTLYLRRIFGISGRRLFITTLICGSAISLMIELLQVLMPQRYSSLLDLMLNITGLCVGILIVRFISNLMRKVCGT